jgi:divinyl protochlorophyllide a 8-vinyl-reductase
MTTSTLLIDQKAVSSVPAPTARIGPNAVTQLLNALRAEGHESLALRIFTTADAAGWLESPPDAMVDERQAVRLHRAVRASLSRQDADRLLTEAGKRTADYLLANRIPRSAQLVLKCLPPRLAAALLVPAISAHAWTFAGSGQFSGRAGSPTVFVLTGNPFCVSERSRFPVCAWHVAVFQRLFQVLVSRHSVVTETHCEAIGGGCCRFVVDWRHRKQQAGSQRTATAAL